MNISNKLDRDIHLNIRLQLLDKNGDIITTLNTFHVNQLYILNPYEKEKTITCVLGKISIACCNHPALTRTNNFCCVKRENTNHAS